MYCSWWWWPTRGTRDTPPWPRWRRPAGAAAAAASPTTSMGSLQLISYIQRCKSGGFVLPLMDLAGGGRGARRPCSEVEGGAPGAGGGGVGRSGAVRLPNAPAGGQPRPGPALRGQGVEWRPGCRVAPAGAHPSCRPRTSMFTIGGCCQINRRLLCS